MFEGMFIPNADNEQQTYEDKGIYPLWVTQVITGNPAYESMTFEQFLQRAQESPMPDLRIMKGHSDYPGAATYFNFPDAVDLSRVVIGINHPTEAAINNFSHKISDSISLAYRRTVNVEMVNINGEWLFSLSFSNFVGESGIGGNALPLTALNQPSQNRSAANQMANEWQAIWQRIYQEWKEGEYAFIESEKSISVAQRIPEPEERLLLAEEDGAFSLTE